MRHPCIHCKNERLLQAEVCWEHLTDRTSWLSAVLVHLREHGGHNTNLAGAAFAGVDFRGIHLEFVNLAGADLRGTCFQGVDLSRAGLAKADLRGSDFSDAQMQVVNARGVLADGSAFRRTRLNGATLANGHFRACDFDAAEFVGGNLRQADLAGSTFRSCRFLRTSLSGANVENADFSNAELRDVAALDLRGLDSAKMFGLSGNSLLKAENKSPESTAPRPSEMKWRHWTEADNDPPSATPTRDNS